jgi:predicted Zn-dependent protease
MRRRTTHLRGLVLILALGSAVGASSVVAQEPSASPHVPATQTPVPSGRAVDATVATRLKTVMVPLVEHMNHPIPLTQIQVGLMDDPQINAANAGGGHFYVTMGLLEKATDDQLRAVMAHETAHADLGHVAKAQRLGAGLTIGMALLDQIVPGSRALAPVAGQLIQSSYSRREEYQADAHGVDILQRAGYDGKTMMAETLTWLMQMEGTGRAGFFATHPGTRDRIAAVRRLPERRR